MYKDILFKAIKNYSEEYLLENKDKFETIEYGNLKSEDEEISSYMVLFNKRFSYKDTEANSKEGWIKVHIANNFVYEMSKDFKFDVYEPYMVKYNDELVPAEVKLFGEVIIFKIDEFGKLIKKG